MRPEHGLTGEYDDAIVKALVMALTGALEKAGQYRGKGADMWDDPGHGRSVRGRFNQPYDHFFGPLDR